MPQDDPTKMFQTPYDVAAQAADIARRAGSHALCPTCTGQKEQPDGTWTITTPILIYVQATLKEFVEAYDNEFISAADLRKALTVLADEIDAELLRD